MISDTNAEPGQWRTSSATEINLTRIAILVGIASLSVITWFQLKHAFNWQNAYKDIDTLGDNCEYRTAFAGAQDFASMRSEPGTWQPILVPLRRNDKIPDVHADGYLHIRCLIDLKPPGKTYQHLSLGRIFGPSAVFVNGKLKLVQDDNMLAEIPLLPEDLRPNAVVEFISRRDKGIHVAGPATLHPVLIIQDRMEMDRPNHSMWYWKVERPMSFATYFGAIFIIFSAAWLAGFRYPDVGWMIVLAAAGVTFFITGYVPYGHWTTTHDLINVPFRYFIIAATGPFLMAFYRLRMRYLSPAATFLVLGCGLSLVRPVLGDQLWRKFGFIMEVPSVLAIVMLGVPMIAALPHFHKIQGRRKYFVGGVMALSVVAILLLITQIALENRLAFHFEPYIVTATITVFALILIVDFVSFRSQFYAEQKRRQNIESDRNTLASDLELGKVVQNLLLPADTSGQAGPCRYSFVYRPYRSISGDWIKIIEEADRASFFIGDVVGKGAQAALGATTIASAFISQPDGTSPTDIVAGLHHGLRRLFNGYITSTLTAAVIPRDGNARFFVSGSAGWFLLRGESLQQLNARGSLLGLGDNPQVGEIPCRLEPGDRVFTFSDGALDGIRSIRALVQHFSERGNIAVRSASDILEICRSLQAGSPPQDDLTVILIEYGVPS